MPLGPATRPSSSTSISSCPKLLATTVTISHHSASSVASLSCSSLTTALVCLLPGLALLLVLSSTTALRRWGFSRWFSRWFKLSACICRAVLNVKIILHVITRYQPF
ncbi:hypothetical protein E4T56_gene18106 [Termitomyces sp. T112]|nr:hypothetical protein E4T56_gene18106 [Termitomyces sp. T112]